MDETLFVNNKLTAKLTRQLEEVMILARSVHRRHAVGRADTIVAVCPTGQPSCRGITPSFSPLRLDTRSYSPLPLATPD
jgi:hypothetical protein